MDILQPLTLDPCGVCHVVTSIICIQYLSVYECSVSECVLVLNLLLLIGFHEWMQRFEVAVVYHLGIIEVRMHDMLGHCMPLTYHGASWPVSVSA